MTLISQGLGSILLIVQGYSVSVTPVTAQTFRQALTAKLRSITAVTDLVGASIFMGQTPETHDLGRDGPTLYWTIDSYPRGHHLVGADGTATATVQFRAVSYRESTADAITLALIDALDGPPINPWGSGAVNIISVVHQDESDEPENPKPGTDQWIYQIVSEYQIKHRTAIPTP